MDQSLRTLCDTLKKTIRQLKPQHQAVSFFLLTGKTRQGKTTLLRQSQYEHIIVHAERGADIYYNQNSVILELSESWLNQSKHLLQYTLKQLNRCHRTVKITGIILCVDINDLFLAEPIEYKPQSKAHAQFLERFGTSLGYRVNTAILFTKLDALAGFCDFFQQDHATELNKPLGFSLDDASKPSELLDQYQTQFDHFIEVLGQQVINKIHPARSSIKRTLIREFPLQLAYLRAAIQSLIQHIPPRRFHLSALYFTSAEQGTASLDKLNQKIQHEYGLTVQDQFPQSTNYQAYFIDGALSAFHAQTKRHAPRITRAHQWAMGSFAGIAGLALFLIIHQYLNSAQILDEASKELLAYDILASQQNKQTAALYHLAKASGQLDEIASNTFSSQSIIQQLKTQLQTDTKQHLNDRYLPHLLTELEQVITDNHQTQPARYDALKMYLMFASPERFSANEIEAWFRAHWDKTNPQHANKKLALLRRALHQPRLAVPINQSIVRDARNDLNALPATYLYYSLAKRAFSKATQPLNIDGFSLASKEVPVYLTKSGFESVRLSLPAIATQLQNDNWVLARQDISDLNTLLQQAYCYEYVVWWQKFMRHTRPLHVENYRQARELTQALHKSDGITQLLAIIQQQVSPESGPDATLFNQEIASKFTELSLISRSAVIHLSETLEELDRFLSTLSIVNDHGKTAFTLTQGRFQGDTLNNPLSSLYGYAHQLPAPVSEWAKNIADDTWFTLISDSRAYINQQWQQTVV
ncbi:MAG TPA: type VI secretion protein IcmF, partial [Legionella sp.]|nr:type VI secretion protein IcmF [Legionella sp.]